MKKLTLLAIALAGTCALAADFQANPVPALGQNAKDSKAFDPAGKGPRILFIGKIGRAHV